MGTRVLKLIYVYVEWLFFHASKSYLLHCALSCAVYCNRPCLFVYLCVFVCGSALLQPARSVCVASGRFFILSVVFFWKMRVAGGLENCHSSLPHHGCCCPSQNNLHSCDVQFLYWAWIKSVDNQYANILVNLIMWIYRYLISQLFAFSARNEWL